MTFANLCMVPNVQETKYGEGKEPSKCERVYAKRYGTKELFRKLDARDAGIEVIGCLKTCLVHTFLNTAISKKLNLKWCV